MSGKLSSGLQEANREALESLVAMGDTSVPGIELSDINDGDIMANTRERVNNQGQFQFVYIPPDGADPIESDWIQQDHKKKVILGWCEGVKNAIISRGQAGMVAANQAALEKKLRKQREEDMADESELIVEHTPVRTSDRGRSAQRPGLASSPASRPAANPVAARPVGDTAMDPSDYIDDQLEIARERLTSAEHAQQDILREVLNARRDYEKWQALSNALSGIGGDRELRGDQGDSADSVILPATTGVQRSVPAVRGGTPVLHRDSGGSGGVQSQPQAVRGAVLESRATRRAREAQDAQAE